MCRSYPVREIAVLPVASQSHYSWLRREDGTNPARRNRGNAAASDQQADKYRALFANPAKKVTFK